MRRTTLLTAVTAGVTASIFFAGIQSRAWAHCEVPCGIYDDHARVRQMLEDTKTIGKAVTQINALAGQHDPHALNQAARWIATKEEHATRIQHTIAQYFLTQRVKPVPAGGQAYDAYVTRLVQHHQVMVAAMKTKQMVDPQRVEQLRAAIEAIAGYYPSAK
ncbi:MAG: superoxide dismutase [Ni] [Planctomycetota bacterium]|jgi:nickel superoxide dismutase